MIAGLLGGRRLSTPSWASLRPTSDRLRETLFDVLGDVVSGARIVDGYAGTGAVGLEALSRGAVHVTFIDSDARAARLIAENLRRCGVERGYTILRGPIRRVWRRVRSDVIDLVFLDPPYDVADVDVLLETVAPGVTPGGLIIVEHSRRRSVPEQVGVAERERTVTAGDSALTFYRCRREEPA